MSVTAANNTNEFITAFRGTFRGILKWEQLEDLWADLFKQADAGWFVYTVGQPPPQAPADGPSVQGFLTRIDARLRTEHDARYCGIVYVDDLDSPGLVKIFDPKNLGVVCGFSERPPLPGWILSRLPPVDLTEPHWFAPKKPARWRRLLSTSR